MHALFVLPQLKISPLKVDLGKILKGDTRKGIIKVNNLSYIALHLKVNKTFSLDTFL